jgi:multiple sugar transport system permease protein
MTTAVEAKVSVSPEVKAVHRRMRRRQALARGLTYLVGILISLWVLIPIIFIASMALTTPAMVRAYPKSILPFIPFSTATMEFFLNSRGILPGIRNSVVVA